MLGRNIRYLLSKLEVHVVHVFPPSGCFVRIKCMRERGEKEGEMEKKREGKFNKLFFFISKESSPETFS